MFDSHRDTRQEQVARKLDDFAVKHSNDDDIVGDVYRVQLHQQIPELANEFTKYCIATHIETGQEFYALVFERSFCPDYKVISAIASDKENLFIKPIAASITRLSTNKVKHFIVIVEKFDYKKNLTSILDSIGEANSKFIITELLPFLSSIIQFCESNGITCGNINPDNILVVENGLMIRELYNSYPHSMQEIPFLATEILDADIAGRKTSNTAADIFAAGITILTVYLGALSFPEGLEKLKRDRLDHGSFLSTIGKRRISDDIKNHVKGCLNDNVHDRWRLRNLLDWANGKLSQTKSIVTHETSDIFAAVSFNGSNYNHFRALASALFHQWEPGTHFLSEERVLKWIQRGSGKSKVMDYLDELTSRDFGTTAILRGFSDKDERLSKAIMILDSQGPYRFNHFAAHLSSMANMFHYGYIRQKKSIQENVIKISLKKSWEDRLRLNSKEDLNQSEVDVLNEISTFYNSQTHGCGAERVLYHLNPHLPCLSPIVFNEYITSLRDLLISLDRISATSSEKMIFDKHIISFIANKISLKREVYTNMLKDIPLQQDNLTIYGLCILVLAIHHEHDLELLNLSKLLGRRLGEFIDKTINNVRLKKGLEDKIKNAAEESDMPKMLKIISNPKVYINDQSGYYKACRDVNMINKKIDALTNNNDVKQFGTLFGQRITVLVSYLIFIIITLFMVL